jgi:hypothetical protein
MQSARRRSGFHRHVRGRSFTTAVSVASVMAASLVGGPLVDAASGRSTKLPLGGIFGGYTTKGWPVVIEVSRNGKRIKRAVAGIASPCTSGKGLTGPDGWRNLPIHGRRFSSTYRESEAQDGLVFEASGTLSGRLNRKRNRISGTWSQTVVVRDPAGATVDTCKSGSLGFTARR